MIPGMQFAHKIKVVVNKSDKSIKKQTREKINENNICGKVNNW